MKRKKYILLIIPVMLIVVAVLFFFTLRRENLTVTEIDDSNNSIIGIEDIDIAYNGFDPAEKFNEDTITKSIEEIYLKEHPFDKINTADEEVAEEEEDEPEENAEVEEEISEEEEPFFPGACPTQTLGCVPCAIGEPYCRYEQGQESGYLGWACQNNNPSNIRYDSGGYRAGIITSMGGPAPCGDKGGFLVFSTYQDGRNGAKAYISGISAGLHSSYHFCGDGNCSLRDFFSKYAPAGDQNDPTSYSNYIADCLGVSVDETPLRWIVENKLDDMVDAIQHKEGYFTKDGML